MTDNPELNAREMTAQEYAAHKAQVLRGAREAEQKASAERVLREAAARHVKKDAKQ